jgi:cadmium resistance protein CadD (predicted permease)
MEDALAIAGVALTAFVSTNMDNLVLLTALLGQRGQRAAAVLVGYVASIAIIAACGLVAARAADAIPLRVIGYLGFVPLAMGVHRLSGALRSATAIAEAPGVPSTLGVGGVAVLTLSNGADTLAVLLPLFAETPEPLTIVLAATLVVAALIWFVLATRIAGHSWVRARVAKVERLLVPLLLIAVGLYILLDSPTDTAIEHSQANGAGA